MATYQVSSKWTDENNQSLLKLLDSSRTENLIQHFEKSLRDEEIKSIDTLFDEIRQMKDIDEETMRKSYSVVTHVTNLIKTSEIKNHTDVQRARNLSHSTDTQDLQEFLAVLCNAVHLHNGEGKWWPRPTQMISWCLLALSDTGKLLEMGTGEGKSCVIAMFAVLRALRGEKVDVVSSSSVLCQRDAEEWTNFYKYFGMTADTNTNKTEDKDRKECYQKDVVYGTIEAFAADHLRQIFEMKDVRPDRSYQCIIIDEVDSLLLDQGLTFLVLEEGVCCTLYDSEEILIKPIAKIISEKVQYTPCTNNKAKISIPEFLKNLVEKKVSVWVQNAFLAKQLKEGREYVVEKDNVCPVDFRSTGIVELNKKWGDGLQQFVEIKHQIKLSTISIVTNYVSNISFFEKYHGKIYGTTGTLGSKTDILFLQDLYPNLSACKMPTFNRKKLFEVKGTLKNSAEEWKSEIKRVVMAQISPNSYRDGRAALVICETINKAKEIHEELESSIPGKINLYCRSDRDSLSKIDEELRPGDVIVATNLAGRGTDIKVSKQVNDNGGLFVILSFLSENTRVELQAFGRTARKGKPGSAQVIMSTEYLQQSFRTVSSLEEAKSTRDRLAAEKINHMMNDVTELKLREDLFSEDDLRKAQESLKYLSEESMVCLQLVKMSSADSANSNPTSLEKQLITNLSSKFFSNLHEQLNIFSEKKSYSDKVKINELSASDTEMLKEFKQDLADTISALLADALVEVFHQKFSSHVIPHVHGIIRRHVRIGLKSDRTEEKLRAGQNNRYIAYMPGDSNSKHKLAGEAATAISKDDVVGTFKLTILGAMPRFKLNSTKNFENFRKNQKSKTRLAIFENSFKHHRLGLGYGSGIPSGEGGEVHGPSPLRSSAGSGPRSRSQDPRPS
ncbi:unnamed protein product, partial [Merluccius merluccius]